VYGGLYLVAEQQWMLFPLFYWVLASDAMGVAQAKRLFPLFASWGLVGKLLGLGIAAAAPALLLRFGIDLGHLLLLNIVMYLGPSCCCGDSVATSAFGRCDVRRRASAPP
jgi:ATP:ADP antiporter, AAA family